MGYGSTFLLCIFLGLSAAFLTGSNWIWPSMIGAVIIAVGNVIFQSKHYQLFRDLKKVSRPGETSRQLIPAYIVLAIIQNMIFVCLSAGVGFLVQSIF